MILYLSPSRQNANTYTGVNTNEKEQMEAVAAIVREKLESGYENIKIVTATPGYTLAKRATECKAKECDFYLAIHSNAGGSGNGAGAVGFYQPGGKNSEALARALVKELDAIAPVKSNRSQNIVNGMSAFNGAGYAEIREPRNLDIPSVLIEVNFHDNATIAKWIVNNKNAIAAAIVKAIANTFGLKARAGTNTQEPASGKISYLARLIPVVPIRKGAGNNYALVKTLKGNGAYTIVEEATAADGSKWGLLKTYEKDKSGWIPLEHTEKV